MKWLRCLFGHNWSGWKGAQDGTCAVVNFCLRCPKRQRKEGYHYFSKWSDPEVENWFSHDGYGLKLYEFTKRTQHRTCTQCGLVDKRQIG